jgi:D-3-phosphoglycerate dehydrogenase
MSKRAVEILKEAGFTVDVKVGMKPEELAAVVGNYHGLGIRSASKVTAATLANPGKLKIIGRAGVGVDNIDTAAAAAKDILVINTPAGNATAAAELAIGLLFALARKIPQAAGLMRQGVWEKKKFMGVELTGKTLGVLGLGNIGRQAAERGVGLKMKVIAHDPVLAPNAQVPAGVEVVSFDDLLAKSDFITLHVPMTKDTNNLFNTATFAKMKKGAGIINCARGGIVNETDVLEALNSGQLGGAALDVFTKEPPEASPLFAHDNLIAVPHLGASTKEAQEKVAIELAEVFVGFLKNGVVRNAVNRK